MSTEPLRCPHCSADISEGVMEDVSDQITHESDWYTDSECPECEKPIRVTVSCYVDVDEVPPQPTPYEPPAPPPMSSETRMKYAVLCALVVLAGCDGSKSDEQALREEGIAVVHQDTARGVVCYAPMRSVRRRYDYPFQCLKVRP